MKNITHDYANERASLITHAQFVWIKSPRHINYAVAHAQCLRQHVYADDRHFLWLGEAKLDDRKLRCLTLQDSFDKTTDTVCTWLSVINTKYTYVVKHFNASKP